MKSNNSKSVTIVSVSEKGRVRGMISVSALIIEKGFTKEFSFDYSEQSNRGQENETISYLVSINKLPKSILDKSGYMIDEKRKFVLVVIEGRGLNYIYRRHAK